MILPTLLFAVLSVVFADTTVAPPTHKCLQSHLFGACFTNNTKWYYDQRSRTCVKRMGVCEKDNSLNQFSSREECLKECASIICNLSKVTGPCEAAMPAYFYNNITKTCDKFTYGGCGGNENNFKDLDKCRSLCSSTQDYCRQPPVTGPCKAAMPRWSYNETLNKCVKFVYGGCSGNRNNFLSEKECMMGCYICAQPMCVSRCEHGYKKTMYGCATCSCIGGQSGGKVGTIVGIVLVVIVLIVIVALLLVYRQKLGICKADKQKKVKDNGQFAVPPSYTQLDDEQLQKKIDVA